MSAPERWFLRWWRSELPCCISRFFHKVFTVGTVRCVLIVAGQNVKYQEKCPLINASGVNGEVGRVFRRRCTNGPQMDGSHGQCVFPMHPRPISETNTSPLPEPR